MVDDRSLNEALDDLEICLARAMNVNDPTTRIQAILSGSTKIKQFLQHDLGIAGGAFGIFDPADGNFHLLQTSKVNDPRILCIDIPTAVDNAAMMELMALSRRSGMNIADQAPEFLQHMLLSGKPTACKMDCDCAQALPWRSLFCGPGEVGFFCMIWRALLYFGQKRGFQEVLSSCFEDDPDNACPAVSWWQAALPPETPEAEWGALLGKLESGVETLGELEITSDLAEAALQSWRKVFPHEEKAVLEGFERSMQDCAGLLGLHSESGITSFGNYVDAYAGHLNITSKRHLDRAIDFCENFLLPSKSVAHNLMVFHGLARFPVMPLYYLSVAVHEPLCHVVLSLWHSSRYRLAPSRLAGTDDFSAVIFGLLACRVPSVHPDQSYVQSVQAQLRATHRMLSRAIHPIADTSFYGGLVEEEVRAGARISSHDGVSHDIKRFNSGLAGNWLIDPSAAFNVTRRAELNETLQLGELCVSQQQELDKLAVAPVRELIQDVGFSLSLWTRSSLHEVFEGDFDNLISFEELALNAFQFSRRATVPLAFAATNFSSLLRRGGTSGMRDAIKAIDAFRRILYSQPFHVDDRYTNLQLFVPEQNEEQALSLWRCMALMLQGAVQHGSLFAPISLTIDPPERGGRFKIKVVNDQLEPDDQLLKILSTKHRISQPVQKAVFHAIRSRTFSSAAKERVQKHTRQLLDGCSRELGGRVAGFGATNSGTFTTEIVVRLSSLTRR